MAFASLNQQVCKTIVLFKTTPRYFCMTYYAIMTQAFEREKNKQATLITGSITGVMILLFIFLKWPLPTIQTPPQEAFLEIELSPPWDSRDGGGGGGGNLVQAVGEKGTAYSPPQPGTKDETKDFETNDKEESSPPIIKPSNPKPEVKTVNPNYSVVKTTTPPVVTTPAPPKPKAVVGKTLTGNGTGGGTADNFEKSGGNVAGGNGVGNGPGYGGGTGGGTGGGNGTGTGTGTGPKRVSGNRLIITSGKLDAGENISGKVEAEIRVSADGVGTFLRAIRGSLMSDAQAKAIIQDWLRRNRFNKTAEESVVVYEFNIRTGG